MDKGLLADATSQDDSPTPGYMLNEISRSTLSNYQACVQIQDYLLARVTQKHHNIKFKALVIIKHVCRTGRPEFKREIQRKVDPIKECLQFKGTPDPLRGDEPNRRVRDAAKEALDAIFDSQMPVTTSAVAAANRIQGMGNDWTPPENQSSKSTGILSSIVSTVSNAVLGDGGNEVAYAGHPGATGTLGGPGNGGKIGGYPGSNSNTSSGGDYGGYSSSGMAGIGNPNFRDARQEKSWVQMASEYVSGKPNSQAPPVSFAAPIGNDYKFTTNRGTNAFGSNESYSPNGMKTNTSYQSWQQPTGVVPDLPQGPPGSGRAGGATSDGSYERSLVESLCEPGGLKPVPNEQKLSEFLNAAPTLSSDVIGTCLLDSLNSDSWQSRTKALMVIQQLVQANNCAGHLDHWQQRIEDVRALLQDSKAGVRTQANKLVKILLGENGLSLNGEEGSSKSSANIMTSGSSLTSNNESLLDMMDGPSHNTTTLPSSTASHGAASSSSALDCSEGLFAGMSIGGCSPPPVPVMSNSAINVVNTTSDFDFLMGDPVSSPPPAPALVKPPSSGFDSGDIFGNMNLNPSISSGSVPNTSNSVSSPPASVSNAFDFMDDLTGPTPLPPQQYLDSGSAGGFSFMNSDNNFGSRVATGSSSSATISSAFVEQPKRDSTASFQDLTAPFMGSSNMGNNNSSQRNVPLNQMMQQQPPQQAAYGFQGGQGYQQYNPQVHQQYGFSTQANYAQPIRPGASVLAPGMLNPVAPRKAIPDAVSTGTNSGFSFMGGSPVKSTGGSNNDSFSFVTDTMKDLTK